MIYRLLNSIYYFLDIVFIMAKEDTYQLVVIKNNELLDRRCYRTLHGAKISFSKLYRWKSFQENVKAVWSPGYPVDPSWCKGIENVL